MLIPALPTAWGMILGKHILIWTTKTWGHWVSKGVPRSPSVLRRSLRVGVAV